MEGSKYYLILRMEEQLTTKTTGQSILINWAVTESQNLLFTTNQRDLEALKI